MSSRTSIRRHLFAGGVVAMLLVGAVGGWAATAELSGAVIANGQLVVESRVKKVQHATGGIVGELRVRDGDRVEAGDILIRLDETQTRANLLMVSKVLDELMARRARLQAEREAVDVIAFPEGLIARKAEPEVSRVVSGETRLFELRRESRAGKRAQLRERIAQLKEEIRGLEVQSAAKAREIELIRRELQGVRDLWKQNLIPLRRVTALEREQARLEGERGRLISDAAQFRGKIIEVELQVLQIDQDLRSEVAAELAQVRTKIAELGERKIAAEDHLMRIDIRAPQDGMVHQLQVHTIGGVIAPGEVIMLVVPQSDSLTLEAKVAPGDIDQLHLHQPAILRFPAFSQRTTPELQGTVIYVSADLTKDETSDQGHYLVRIAIPDEERARLEGLKLVPGMPVEALIQTAARSVLSYFVKPLTDYAARAFRDG